MIDVAVIGGGAAGLSAALYAARAGKSVTVYEREALGGQITKAPLVENYPGISEISGIRLGERMAAGAQNAGAEICFSEVQSIEKEAGLFQICSDNGKQTARTVIYACGARPRPLDLPGEAALVGRGISYCALCDGTFFRGMDVAVVGGGNSALNDALLLSEICRNVTLIHRRNTFRAEQILIDRAKNRKNIAFLTDTVLTELIEKGGQLDGLMLKSTDGKTQRLAISGLFAALGRLPNTDLIARRCTRDANGYVQADANTAVLQTPGLFAAGDCRSKSVRQLVTAAADGATSAVSACKYLETACGEQPSAAK